MTLVGETMTVPLRPPPTVRGEIVGKLIATSTSSLLPTGGPDRWVPVRWDGEPWPLADAKEIATALGADLAEAFEVIAGRVADYVRDFERRESTDREAWHRRKRARVAEVLTRWAPRPGGETARDFMAALPPAARGGTGAGPRRAVPRPGTRTPPHGEAHVAAAAA
jgi:hypothetical protein